MLAVFASCAFALVAAPGCAVVAPRLLAPKMTEKGSSMGRRSALAGLVPLIVSAIPLGASAGAQQLAVAQQAKTKEDLDREASQQKRERFQKVTGVEVEANKFDKIRAIEAEKKKVQTIRDENPPTTTPGIAITPEVCTNTSAERSLYRTPHPDSGARYGEEEDAAHGGQEGRREAGAQEGRRRREAGAGQEGRS